MNNESHFHQFVQSGPIYTPPPDIPYQFCRYCYCDRSSVTLDIEAGATVAALDSDTMLRHRWEQPVRMRLIMSTLSEVEGAGRDYLHGVMQYMEAFNVKLAVTCLDDDADVVELADG